MTAQGEKKVVSGQWSEKKVDSGEWIVASEYKGVASGRRRKWPGYSFRLFLLVTVH